MSNIYEKKSPCCRAKTYKFGGKRRQCSLCKKTWTLWPKKRGRKLSRPRHNLVNKIVAEKQKLSDHQRRWNHLSLSAWSVRLNSGMQKFINQSQLETIPPGGLILVIDALWFRFRRYRWTMYLMAARPVKQDKAIILDPILILGRESCADWTKAINQLPESIKSRIRALVCDGVRGNDRIAKNNGWIIQRCHFHLLAQLQVNRGRWKRLPDSRQREVIYQTIRKILVVDSRELDNYVNKLTCLLSKDDCPKRLKAIGQEFLRKLDQFRAYRDYPQLRLPNTTNSIESLNRIIRSHCKHLRTSDSLELRTKTLIRMRKTITCKPKIFQQN